MSQYIIEDCYTGGGCEHLSVKLPEYGLEFAIMSNDEMTYNQIPLKGEKWCFNLSHIGEGMDGEYLEIGEGQTDFDPSFIGGWCEGYIIAKGYRKNEPNKPRPYTLDDLYCSINDIYTNYDEGKLNIDEANTIAKRCAQAYIAHLEDIAE